MLTSWPKTLDLRILSRPAAQRRVGLASLLLTSVLIATSSGCTSIQEYVHNGFKVGPNYCKPPAPIASEWIDSKSIGINVATADLRGWWKAFNDPRLDALIQAAYQQNISLRSAGTRIMASWARKNIAVGNIFPQTQQAFADYSHNQTSAKVANPLPNHFFDDNLVGANLSWELDFWGRFRRGVEAASAELDASVENYDDALVLLLSEVASTYIEIRVFQERLRDVDENIAIQTVFVKQTDERLKGGAGRRIDLAQMRSNLEDTLSLKEELEIGLRVANDQLCVLLGIPVRDLLPELGTGDIPVMLPDIAIGMPADLLRRRPDLRKAERLVAAQSARIGIATSDLYPRVSIVGAIGWEAKNFADLFSASSMIGTIGPSMQWNILNYGRLLNAIRVEDALFQTAVADYQNLVLQADQEVEDSLVLYLRSQKRTRELTGSVIDAKIAVEEALVLSKDVKFDINTAFVTSNFLVTQQDKLAQSRGDIALGFIQIYKALGGGWEIRLPEPPPANGAPVEMLPAPSPTMLPMAARLMTPQVLPGAPDGPALSQVHGENSH